MQQQKRNDAHPALHPQLSSSPAPLQDYDAIPHELASFGPTFGTRCSTFGFLHPTRTCWGPDCTTAFVWLFNIIVCLSGHCADFLAVQTNICPTCRARRHSLKEASYVAWASDTHPTDLSKPLALATAALELIRYLHAGLKACPSHHHFGSITRHRRSL